MPGSEAHRKKQKKRQQQQKSGKKKREKKKAKVCRHTNEAKTRGKKPHNVESPLGGVSQCCEVGPSMGTERGSPGRAGGRGCPSPRLCPACSRRAGGQRRAAKLRAQAARAPAASAPRGQGTSHFNGGATATASFFLSPSPPPCAAAGVSLLPPAAANTGSAPPPPPLLRLTYGTAARTTSGPTRDSSVRGRRKGGGLRGGESVRSGRGGCEETCERHQHVRLPV